MAKVPNAVERLQKITTVWVGCTSVTDDRQTDRRQHIANVNASPRSLKITTGLIFFQQLMGSQSKGCLSIYAG